MVAGEKQNSLPAPPTQAEGFSLVLWATAPAVAVLRFAAHQGWGQSMGRPLTRREVPAAIVPLI